jgi:hypothetical protein
MYACVYGTSGIYIHIRFCACLKTFLFVFVRLLRPSREPVIKTDIRVMHDTLTDVAV